MTADANVTTAPTDAGAAAPTAGAAADTTTAAEIGAIDVTPGEIVLGGVTVSLALQPPRHMVDQTIMQTADPAQRQQVAETSNAVLSAPDASKGPATQGAVVLAGMTRVTYNIDPTQPVPSDSQDIKLRHAVVTVRNKDSGQPVPYLAMTMDVLLDGRPISYDQPAVPMTLAGGDSTQLYYGNNIRFGPRGTYQVFIRMQSSPFLGKDQPQAALFNLVVR